MCSVLLDNFEAYTLGMKQENMAVFCNYSSTALALQDFDESMCSLKVSQVVLFLLQTVTTCIRSRKTSLSLCNEEGLSLWIVASGCIGVRAMLTTQFSH